MSTWCYYIAFAHALPIYPIVRRNLSVQSKQTLRGFYSSFRLDIVEQNMKRDGISQFSVPI